MENISLLQEGAAALGVHLPDAAADQFMRYMALLLEWNEKINLTAITRSNDIVRKHFLDSLSLLTVMPHDEASGQRVIDVGTGAGFPGVPLKIARPGMHVTLLDALNKRVLFLSQLIDGLCLHDITYVHSRAEDAGVNPFYRETYDYAVSRAVANLSVLAEYCLPLVKIGGKFISMKGPEVKDEIVGAKTIIKKLGGEVSAVKTVKIPFADITHSLIVISKLSQTPSNFPRKPGKIQKNPVMR